RVPGAGRMAGHRRPGRRRVPVEADRNWVRALRDARAEPRRAGASNSLLGGRPPPVGLAREADDAPDLAPGPARQGVRWTGPVEVTGGRILANPRARLASFFTHGPLATA